MKIDSFVAMHILLTHLQQYGVRGARSSQQQRASEVFHQLITIL